MYIVLILIPVTQVAEAIQQWWDQDGLLNFEMPRDHIFDNNNNNKNNNKQSLQMESLTS